MVKYGYKCISIPISSPPRLSGLSRYGQSLIAEKKILYAFLGPCSFSSVPHYVQHSFRLSHSSKVALNVFLERISLIFMVNL